MRHATLFSGVGAPELAAYWLGWENVFHCEINPFCQQVLSYWFNKSECYEDITKTDFRKWEGKIDVLTGGFPCQPFSVAGRRKGAEDNRYLWPEFRRAIREVKPRWIVGENVAGIISMVQPGKEIDMEVSSTQQPEGDKETIHEQEFVIETICRDLESEGYTVQPIVIPACAIGAPHRRDRVWFIAYRNAPTNTDDGSALRKPRKNERTSYKERLQERDEVQQPNQSNSLREPSSHSAGCGRLNGSSDWKERSVHSDQEWNSKKNQPEWAERECRTCANIRFNEYSDGNGLERRFYQEKERVPAYKSEERNSCGLRFWEDFPTQPPLCRGDDGIPDRLDIEAVFKGVNYTGRSSTYNRWRTESIKAYGNAMVPQVIYQIYKYINDIENQINEKRTHTNLRYR